MTTKGKDEIALELATADVIAANDFYKAVKFFEELGKLAEASFDIPGKGLLYQVERSELTNDSVKLTSFSGMPDAWPKDLRVLKGSSLTVQFCTMQQTLHLIELAQPDLHGELFGPPYHIFTVDWKVVLILDSGTFSRLELVKEQIIDLLDVLSKR
jgi:hypothetical protein